MHKFVAKVVLCFLSAVIMLSGCSQENELGDPPVKNQDIVAHKFVIALLPNGDVFRQKKHYEPLTDYLSKAIGREVGTKLLDNYEAVYAEMSAGKVDAAFFGSLSYVIMDSMMPTEPIARPYLKNGVSTYKGVVFALKGSRITNDVRTWKGKRLALVRKSSTTGYIFPRWYLWRRGIKDFEGYFSKVVYSGSLDASILDVYEGQADIGCADDKIFYRLQDNMLFHDKFVVLAESDSVPSRTLCIRKDSNSRIRDLIKTALLEMDKTPEGRDVLKKLGVVRFIETTSSMYQPLRGMIADLGLKPEFFSLEETGRSRQRVQ